MLGSKIVNEAEKDFEVYGTYDKNVVKGDCWKSLQLDITDKSSVERVVRKIEPDCVILTAAMTDVDACETERERAWLLNVQGPKNVAEITCALKIKIIYISTDYVFDGKVGNYDELDKTNPLSYYGLTKLEGEKIVQKTCEDYVIARVAALYGWNTVTSKFNSITWIIDSLRKGKEVKLFSDQYISPTFVDHCASVLILMFRKNMKGVFHASGGERLSRLDIGSKVADMFSLPKELIRAVPLDSAELKAKRPKDSSLNVCKIEKELNRKMCTLEEGLIAMKLEEEKKSSSSG